MRNLDRLRIMPVEELAEYLISLDFYSKSENLYSDEDIIWRSPSKKHFEQMDDAINDCIKWLNEEIGE